MCFNKQKHWICKALYSLTFILTFSINSIAKPIEIVTITEDFSAIAASIGGDLVHVEPLVKGSRNLHHVNPKPSMVMKVKKADLLIRLGMGVDTWIDSLIEIARNKRVFSDRVGYLDASLYITKLEVPTEAIDGSMGDVHAAGNPHYWLNPLNGKIIAKQIRDHLSLIDPDNKAIYNANYDQFSKEIDKKMIGWRESIKKVKQTSFITYHKVWSYFFDAFKLDDLAQLEPLPGIPPTAKHLLNVQNRASKNSKAPIILCANFYPKNVCKRFAKTVDAKFVHLASNVGEDGISTYPGLFDYIITEVTQ